MLWTAVAVALWCLCSAQPRTTELWLSAAVEDEAALQAADTTAGAASWTLCAARGAVMDWPLMVCYDGSTCALWGPRHVRKANAKKSGSLSGAKCMIRQSFTGCFRDDDTVAPLGETHYNEKCEEKVCEEGGFVTKPPKQKTTCTSPFKDEGEKIGCLYVVTEKQHWCGSLKACQDAEGDLYSPDSNEQFQSLQSFLEKNDKYLDEDVWVGAEKVGGKWQWRRNNISIPEDFWKDDPDDSDSHALLKKGDKKLESKGDSDNKHALCRVWT